MVFTPEKTIEDVVTDFLGAAPTLAEIAAYRLPDDLQARAHDLLGKNRAVVYLTKNAPKWKSSGRLTTCLLWLKRKHGSN